MYVQFHFTKEERKEKNGLDETYTKGRKELLGFFSSETLHPSVNSSLLSLETYHISLVWRSCYQGKWCHKVVTSSFQGELFLMGSLWHHWIQGASLGTQKQEEQESLRKRWDLTPTLWGAVDHPTTLRGPDSGTWHCRDSPGADGGRGRGSWAERSCSHSTKPRAEISPSGGPTTSRPRDPHTLASSSKPSLLCLH